MHEQYSHSAGFQIDHYSSSLALSFVAKNKSQCVFIEKLKLLIYISSTAPVTVHEQYPHSAGFQIDHYWFQTDHYSSTDPVTIDEQYFRKQGDKSPFMNSTSHCSSTVSDTIIQSYCLLSVEKVFTRSKSISLSGFSTIKTEHPKLPSAYKRKLKSQSSSSLFRGFLLQSKTKILQPLLTTLNLVISCTQ